MVSPVNLSADALRRRGPVWEALSELFLDTELQRGQYRLIAQAVITSGFTRDEVRHILWDEVFPALADNLRAVAGEWAGFDAAWLRQRIVDVMQGEAPGASAFGWVSREAVKRSIADSWRAVEAHLPPALRHGPDVPRPR